MVCVYIYVWVYLHKKRLLNLCCQCSPLIKYKVMIEQTKKLETIYLFDNNILYTAYYINSQLYVAIVNHSYVTIMNGLLILSFLFSFLILFNVFYFLYYVSNQIVLARRESTIGGESLEWCVAWWPEVSALWLGFGCCESLGGISSHRGKMLVGYHPP